MGAGGASGMCHEMRFFPSNSIKCSLFGPAWIIWNFQVLILGLQPTATATISPPQQCSKRLFQLKSALCSMLPHWSQYQISCACALSMPTWGYGFTKCHVSQKSARPQTEGIQGLQMSVSWRQYFSWCEWIWKWVLCLPDSYTACLLSLRALEEPGEEIQD